jgi:hypothetical protein
MKSVFESISSLFDFGSSASRARIRKIAERPPFQWYHKGPWWEHPMWGDTWKKK